MWCIQCDKNLVDCTCADLEERLDKLAGCRHLDPNLPNQIREARRKKVEIEQTIEKKLN